MEHNLYTEDHEQFRSVVEKFVAREVVPNQDRWNQDRLTGRDVWLTAGEHGLIGLSGPEEYGGAGLLHDFRYRNVVIEELCKVGAAALHSSFSLQDDILMPYFVSLANDEQKARWLPGLCSGELIAAIAMTEPGAGSDLKGVSTSAVRADGGWRLNGSKTFITSGIQADVVVVVARTDPDGGSDAFSLLVVERDMPGFSRGRKLDKIGLVAQDTAELFFKDVLVPDDNVLGEVGGGFRQLMRHLPLERLSIAAGALAAAEAALAWTVEYTDQRRAFGRPIGDFQHSRFVLAEIATELDVTRAFLDKAILAHNDRTLTAIDAAKAKWWASEVQNRTIDRCVQLHGGYGYMLEYPIGRAFVDARVQKIYGGTNEIMKELIGRDLFGRR
jgi:long-chain-acyl-CoA dehydrogenase